MPRFLPTLVQRIKTIQKGRKHQSPTTRSSPSRSTRHSVQTTPPYPNFSPHGRKESILLDDVNPILHSDVFTQHKLAPSVIPSLSGRGRHSNGNRQAREMTDGECDWWSNPYLRMLASPLRQCIVTEKQLPADFMVRLAALELSGPRLSRTITALLPDGVEHSRFRRHNSGKGYYIACRKESIDELVSRSSYKRIPAPSKLQVHSLLATQIGHQLRLKVLQELELLAESLRCAPQESRENTILRRLTRTEWVEVKTTGRISQSGAVAVLVVPPINKRTLYESHKAQSSRVLPTLPPLSILHQGQVPESTYTGSLPTQQVPYYNGLSLFPSACLRLRLYKALQMVLLVERRARWRQNIPSQVSNCSPSYSNNKSRGEKSSHAYLLRSDRNTVRRTDSARLAIALWRIRMWEGQGWEAELGSYGGWTAGKSNTQMI
ncbi:hypothetical protein JB92DRAFT_2738255 [Gautieria morchelliformis]|nr:hypothetical protein JB92DRAFT_2738255 [Gautieria morchelliformis]